MDRLEERPSYYTVIPARVRYNKNISIGAKLLYGEITALCEKHGFCWASNEYFSNLYDVSVRTIRIWITTLVEEKLLIRELIKKENSNEVDKRILILPEAFADINEIQKLFKSGGNNLPDTSGKKLPQGEEKNFPYNNTSINNIPINTNTNICGQTKNKFKKPTIEEIKTYCLERRNTVDAEKFFDYYESNGWKVGKNSMKDWKACVRTWEKNRYDKQQYQTETKYNPNALTFV